MSSTPITQGPNVASGAPRSAAEVTAGPAGQLELLVDEPQELAPGSAPKRVAVICHPHPLYGGTMTNKVVHTLARTFNDLGAPAVRFNFRGVGKSAGTHDDGRGETDDALAVVRWASERWPGAEIWLAGFSFGAAMALRASFRVPVARLVTVAPALRWLAQVDTVPDAPWLIVQGDRDDLVNVEEVRQWVSGLASPPTLHILAGGEHFFHGRLTQLRDVVTEWLAQREA